MLIRLSGGPQAKGMLFKIESQSFDRGEIRSEGEGRQPPHLFCGFRANGSVPFWTGSLSVPPCEPIYRRKQFGARSRASVLDYGSPLPFSKPDRCPSVSDAHAGKLWDKDSLRYIRDDSGGATFPLPTCLAIGHGNQSGAPNLSS